MILAEARQDKQAAESSPELSFSPVLFPTSSFSLSEISARRLDPTQPTLTLPQIKGYVCMCVCVYDRLYLVLIQILAYEFHIHTWKYFNLGIYVVCCAISKVTFITCCCPVSNYSFTHTILWLHLGWLTLQGVYHVPLSKTIWGHLSFWSTAFYVDSADMLPLSFFSNYHMSWTCIFSKFTREN